MKIANIHVFAASQYELLDKKLREMLYSVNRTSRRVAVQRILKDRGLEHEPQLLNKPKVTNLCRSS